MEIDKMKTWNYAPVSTIWRIKVRLANTTPGVLRNGRIPLFLRRKSNTTFSLVAYGVIGDTPVRSEELHTRQYITLNNDMIDNGSVR